MMVTLYHCGFWSGYHKAWPRSTSPTELPMKFICRWPKATAEPGASPFFLHLLSSRAHTGRSREWQRTHHQATRQNCSVPSSHSRVLKVLIFHKNAFFFLFLFSLLEKPTRNKWLYPWELTCSAGSLQPQADIRPHLPDVVPLPPFRKLTWRISISQLSLVLEGIFGLVMS